MSIKRPLVRSEGNELLEDLPIVDTISAEVISEVVDKRFVTEEEKILIHAAGPKSDWNATTGEEEILNKPNVDILKYGISTGILKGGTLSINTDNTKLDIGSGKSVYCNFTNTDSPIIEILQWDAVTIDPEISNLTPRLWIGVSRVSQGIPTFVFEEEFTALQKRTIAVLGRIWGTGTTSIAGVGQYSTPGFNTSNSLIDLISTLGSINKSGNNFYPNDGGNLLLNKTSGISFRFSANFLNEPTSPNIQNDSSLTGITEYNYHLHDATSTLLKTTVDPNNYDVNGVLTTVPDNKFTIQRVYYFPKSQVVDIVYGQTLYDSMDLAISGMSSDSINMDEGNVNLLDGSILRSYIIVKKGTTNLTNVANCKMLTVANFGMGAASSGVSGVTDHSDLTSLDYSSSGHTGFLPSTATQDDVVDGVNYKRLSEADKTKLDGIAVGAEVNVQADWDAIDGDSFIRNKPTIPETLVAVSGSNKYVQYNRDGNLSSDIKFTWDYDEQSLNIGQATILPDNPLALSGSADAYLQLNMANKSILGSSDFVLTADDGNDSEKYGDIGFCNSGYSSSLWDLFTPYDMYIFSDGGDLTLGSTTPGKSVKFFIANILHEAHNTDLVAQIDDTGMNLPSGSTYKVNGIAIGGGITEEQIKELVYAQVLMYGG